MGIKEDYQQAATLAKAGKYEQARRLLIVHDHAKTNALLAKVNNAIGSSGAVEKPKAKTTIVGLLVGVVSAFVNGVIVLWFASLIDNSNSIGISENYVVWGVLFALWIALIYIVNRVYKRLAN